MKINDIDQSNYNLLTAKHFKQTFPSDLLADEPICALLIRTGPLSDTENPDVKFEKVIIEIYVHNSIDTAGIEGFRCRTHMIVDRLIRLLHKKYINNDYYRLSAKNELQSSTPEFKRYSVTFQYKSIYS